MRVFSPDDAGFLRLSPYTRINIQPNMLTIHQTLFERAAMLECPTAFSTQLLDLLSRGATEEEVLTLLIDFMHEVSSARELIDKWLQIGVLE